MRVEVGDINTIGCVQIVANTEDCAISPIKFWINDPLDAEQRDALVKEILPTMTMLEDQLNQALKKVRG